MLDNISVEFNTRLKTIRIIPDSKNNIEYRQQCYDKYKSIIPMNKFKLQEYDNDTMTDILIAHQLFFYDELKSRLDSGAKKEIDKSDLTHFLSKDINYAFTQPDKLNRSQQGLDFIKPFVRDIIYQTGVKGKYSDPRKNLDDIRSFHRAVCVCFIFNSEINVLTISKLATTMQLTGSVQVVSNFRPMSAAYLFQKYGVENTTNKEVNILVPSEGFLGRLLASYYIAKHNPDRIINYHTIDPNPLLVEPFNEMVKYLKKHGGIMNSVTNWNPVMHTHGSEVPEARLRDTLGIEFDLTFTSPPYIGKELYIGAAELYITPKDLPLSEQTKFINGDNSIPDTHKIRILASENTYRVGDTYKHNGKEYNIASIVKNTQSHSIGKSSEYWMDYFFAPTVDNMTHNLKVGGYQIWNVGNIRECPDFEDRVENCCKQHSQLEYVDTLKYELSRRPGSRDKKLPWEAVFVFRKVK